MAMGGAAWRPTGSAPRRELPKPRGRFTRLVGGKRSLADLAGEDSREMVAALIEQQARASGLEIASENAPVSDGLQKPAELAS